MTPRIYVLQMQAVLVVLRRRADERTAAAWLSGALAKVAKLPPLSDFLTVRGHVRTPEEHSLELQAQMRVTRELMARQGRIRSWSEWQTGS